MNTNLIYNYDELKLKLFKYAKYKVMYKKVNNTKFININKKIETYKNESNQEKKFITMFIVSDNKVIMQYNERLDKFNLNFLNPYVNEIDKIKIVMYFFDITNSREDYDNFLNIFEKITLKANIKNYISIFTKINLPLNGFLSIYFTLFTIFALYEYGIPINKVTDLHILVILQIFSIFFLSFIFSFFTILIIILLIPCALYFYLGFNNLIILAVIQFILIIATYFYLYKKHPTFLYKLPILIIKPSLYLVALTSSCILIAFLTIIGQSIFSSFLENSPLYDKSGYYFAIREYKNKFSGYPKIIIKNNKEYYVPIVDSNYYYGYDIKKVKNIYLSILKKNESKFNSICEDKSSKEKFQKNFIVNNPYIKPGYLDEKIKIDDTDLIIWPLQIKNHKLITLEEINEFCKK